MSELDKGNKEAYDAGMYVGLEAGKATVRVLEERLKTARRALQAAARAFRLYEDLHRSKGTLQAAQKARDNAELALKMETAIKETEETAPNVVHGLFTQN